MSNYQYLFFHIKLQRVQKRWKRDTDRVYLHRRKLNGVKTCKVKSESACRQHHVVIGEFKIKQAKKVRKITKPKIKWWKLKEMGLQFRDGMLRE